jgi:arginine kinase
LGDRFFEASGFHKNWPEGRGVFHNQDKTLLVWVNEEDHLKIISMQNTPDIEAAFDRLARICAEIEKVS